MQRLDNRLDKDQSAIQNPENWITSWTTLVSTLSQNPDTAARLLISPLTNPDIGGLKYAFHGNLLNLLASALAPLIHKAQFLTKGWVGVCHASLHVLLFYGC